MGTLHHIFHANCGGCGRFFPITFPECPFCYVQEFLEVESLDDACPICGEVHETECPECGRGYKDADTYCTYCGHNRPNGGKKVY
jgi:hypothetical protein